LLLQEVDEPFECALRHAASIAEAPAKWGAEVPTDARGGQSQQGTDRLPPL
jgi:hypothetical protein